MTNRKPGCLLRPSVTPSSARGEPALESVERLLGCESHVAFPEAEEAFPSRPGMTREEASGWELEWGWGEPKLHLGMNYQRTALSPSSRHFAYIFWKIVVIG